jgi:hypothetical protein
MMKTRSLVAVVVAGAALLGAAGVAYLTWHGGSKTGLPCQVVADGRTYRLDREQAANAGVITTAASAVGLPHHAVTIGIAAALQESQLHNLTYGDRDSLGLFQQRPSQGWGTPAQILDPRFAAESFFRALASTDGWAAMSVSDAAQRVQRSASPTAYAAWENEARSLARATTGELPGALTCSA